jgi:hypothetical protein
MEVLVRWWDTLNPWIPTATGKDIYVGGAILIDMWHCLAATLGNWQGDLWGDRGDEACGSISHWRQGIRRETLVIASRAARARQAAKSGGELEQHW